jgi:hypothetical protein
MKINKQSLRQIIKEELQNVLMEQNFDMDVGYPLNVKGLEILFKNDNAMKNIENVGEGYLKILRTLLKAKQQRTHSDEEIENYLKKFLQQFKKHKEIKDSQKLKTKADELVLQATGDDYIYKLKAAYKNFEDYETLEEYYDETYKEFKESVDLANQLKNVLSKAKYDKSPTAYQFYDKMKMFTAKAKAKQNSLKQINKKAAKNLAADPDGFVKALTDEVSFSLEIFQKQAEFIIKYTRENPDKSLPIAMKDFEKQYRGGPLKILHQQIENIAKLQSMRNKRT